MVEGEDEGEPTSLILFERNRGEAQADTDDLLRGGGDGEYSSMVSL